MLDLLVGLIIGVVIFAIVVLGIFVLICNTLVPSLIGIGILMGLIIILLHELKDLGSFVISEFKKKRSR